MEQKNSNIEPHKEELQVKEKQVMSMDSAIKRLQGLTKTATLTETKVDNSKDENIETEQNQPTQESMAKISAIAIKAKEEAETKAPAKKQMQVDYNLEKNDLNPAILDDDTLSEEEDAKHNKRYAWLAYILFFIPLLINKKSPFVRLHANEGLDVFIIDVFASILIICGKFINFGSKLAIIGHLLFLVGIGLFALTTVTKIFQIIRVAMGKKNQTPWLWKTRIIK